MYLHILDIHIFKLEKLNWNLKIVEICVMSVWVPFHYNAASSHECLSVSIWCLWGFSLCAARLWVSFYWKFFSKRKYKNCIQWAFALKTLVCWQSKKLIWNCGLLRLLSLEIVLYSPPLTKPIFILYYYWNNLHFHNWFSINLFSLIAGKRENK